MVIKSSNEYTKMFIVTICIILLFWGIVFFFFDFGRIIISVISLLLLAFSFVFWISSTKTLIMNEFGCTVKVLFVSRKYKWLELNIEIIDYDGMIGYRDPYSEGVIFFKGKRSPKSLKPSSYSLFTNPFKFFYVNFKPDNSNNKGVFCPDLYSVSKDKFLAKMKEWGIAIK